MTKNDQRLPIKFTFLQPAVHLRDLYILGHRIRYKEKNISCHQNPDPGHKLPIEIEV
jgi:hypothetical protein